MLRVERSVDQIADIKGDYERSCFGMNLEELVQLTQPVSEVPLPASNPDYFFNEARTAKSKSSSSAGNDTTKLSIPKELWRLVDALWSGNALREKDLFNTALADSSEVAAIRLALDRGTDFPTQCSPQSIVEVLLTFFAALPRPLLPPDIYPPVRIYPFPVTRFTRLLL